ncbi:MAG: hypothetical protein KGN84_11760 [Acidobacteriota bacterium]|nr:hypothetical protein [Acidobacteriota bacterium]
MRTRKAHFDSVQWADFARGAVSSDESGSMARHRSECAVCAYLADLFGRVYTSASADRWFSPPDELVKTAESAFSSPARRPAESGRAWAGLRRLLGELQWDSCAPALAEGVRSLGRDSLHSVFSAGRFSVDIWLDNDVASNALTITGQIADSATPGAPMEDMRALLMAGDSPVASVQTTKFGEFLFRCEPRRGLRLLFPMEPAGEYVEIPLKLPKF